MKNKIEQFNKNDFLYYKGLAHPKRIEILNTILKYNDGISHTQIFKETKIPIQTLDFHLKILKQANLIKSKRNNKYNFYFSNINS